VFLVLIDLYLETCFLVVVLGVVLLLELPEERPSIRACTRKGATLEFDDKRAFLAWLFRALGQAEVGGSAKGYQHSLGLEEWLRHN